MHPHDEKWATQMVLRLPKRHQQRAVDGYKAVFAETMREHSHEPEHVRMNKARFAANQRLLKFVKTITGYTG